MMTNDNTNPDGLDGPTEAEVIAIWARVIRKFQQSKVCFCAGRNGQRDPAPKDFTTVLPMIQDCDFLVFSEPRRSKLQVQRLVREYKLNPVAIPRLGLITEIAMENTANLLEADYRGLFREPAEELVPEQTRPGKDMFWADYARLVIDHRREVKLLHVGLPAMDVGPYLFEPHGVQFSILIGSAF